MTTADPKAQLQQYLQMGRDAVLWKHAGHADIVRELIDGAAGHRIGHSNLPPGDQAW
jgi:hypothetical protein